MYCQKCGCKVTEKEKKCPNCGRNVEIEYCGGFWGLVGEEKKQSEISQNKNTDPVSSEITIKKEKQEEMDTVTEKEYKKILTAKKVLNKRYKKLKKRSGICIGILVIALILQSVSMVTVINEKADIETKYETLSDDYELGQTFRNTYEEIKKQIEYVVTCGKQKYKEGMMLGKEILKKIESVNEKENDV